MGTQFSLLLVTPGKKLTYCSIRIQEDFSSEFTDKVDLKFQVLVKMLAFWDLSDFGAEKGNLSMESSIIP